MIRLFYHSDFPGIWLLKIHDLETTRIEKHGCLVVLYNQDLVIGYNLLKMPELSNGFHYLNEEKLALINKLLGANGFDALVKYDNPIVVGEIIELKELANKGHVCKVNIGDRVIQIVTKAPNVRLNQKVVCALDKAVLANGDIVSEGKVYDYLSQGMFGSKNSLLKIKEDLGSIIELKATAKIGNKDWEAEL